MIDLDRYGTVLRRYAGSGCLTISSGANLQCRFVAVQYSDGAVRAGVEIPDAGRAEANAINSLRSEEVTGLVGATDDGKSVELGGQILWHNVKLSLGRQNALSMGLVAQTMRVGHKPSDEVAKQIRFGITNFEFEGNEPRVVRTDTHELHDRGILTMQLPLGKVVIERLPNYEDAVKVINALYGVDATCEAAFNLPENSSVFATESAANDLCAILSLARGTPITWIYHDTVNSAGQQIASVHNHAVTRSYAGRSAAIIDPGSPQAIKELVETAFAVWDDVKDSFNLQWAIQSYLEAKRREPYLEARALAAIQALELLVGGYARRVASPPRMFVVDELLFESKKLEICQGLQPLLQAVFHDSHPLAKDELSAMANANRLKELNRRSFGSNLRHLLRHYQLKSEVGKAELLGKVRNNLVHAACLVNVVQEFPGGIKPEELHKEQVRRYFTLCATVDKLLLRILGYQGHMLDCSNGWSKTKL